MRLSRARPPRSVLQQGVPMRLSKARQTPRCEKKFLPQVETLEGRCCPSVMTSLQGGVLTVTGDGAADAVQITAQDRGFSVTAGNVTRSFQDVRKVVVDLKGGNDTVTLDLSGAGRRAVDVDLTTGAGEDNVTVTLGSTARAPVNLRVNLDGGDDRFTLSADGLAR